MEKQIDKWMVGWYGDGFAKIHMYVHICGLAK